MAYTQEGSDEAHEVSALHIDGYAFGDRLLEEVMFKLTIEDGQLRAECLDKYNPGIKWEFWEKACVEYAVETDVLSVDPKGADDDGYIEH